MLFLSHFHYVLVPGAVFSIIAAVYYWIPKWTGRMYNEKAGQWHFWLSAIFINLLFFPQHFAGLAGMQRRVPDYAVQFTDRKSVVSGKSVSVRVDLGGRRIIKKKKIKE